MRSFISGRRTAGLIIGAAAGAVLLGLLSWFLIARGGGTGKQIPLQAFFTAPVQKASYPVGTPIPVKAVARGQKTLTRAELWVDGAKVETVELSAVTAKLFSWRYTPVTQGTHSLTVHALDSKGHAVVSEILVLEATAPVTWTAQVPAAAGESLGDVAKRFGATEADTAAVNPGVETGQPLGAGTMISIPVKTGAADETPVLGEPPVSPLSTSVAEPGMVTVPAGVSGAYLYATEDDHTWHRVPAEEGSMLVPQGTELLVPGGLIPSLGHESPDRSPSFQTWGWLNGKLTDLGTVASLPNPTRLDVCDSTYDCYGDMGGSWVKETSIPEGEADQMRKLWWYNPDPLVKQAIFQISLFPFADSTTPAGIYESLIDDKGQFSVDFATIFTSQDPSSDQFLPSAQLNMIPEGSTSSTTSMQALAKLKSSSYWKNNLATWYIRVVPLIDGQAAGDPSPQVQVHQIPSVPAEDIKIYTPPAIYDVTVKEFKPIHFPEPGVCHGAMILDTDFTVTQMGKTTTLFPAGTVLCPAPYKGQGEKAWYEQLWDFVSSGVGWISEAYNALKNGIVSAVGGLVCGGSSECEAALAAGLDMGMIALGIPPSLPNFDQLMNEGFDYVAATLAEQAGCPDVACKELIKQGLSEALETTRDTNPGCMDAGQAHNEGIEPLCLPAGVTAHADPRAQYASAVAMIEVTRNATPIVADDGYEMFKNSYALSVRYDGTNAGPVGGRIINIPPYDESMTITEPLAAEVFKSTSASIPPLAAGESVILPFSLVAPEYWVPGHKELMGGWTTVEYRDGWPQYYYDDWWLLYWGGTIEVDARITACDPNMMSACLISTDSLGPVQIPLTAN